MGRGRSLLALVRLPNLFTAPPDIVLGAALATTVGASARPRAVAGAAVASMVLYAAGTTLNDYADAAIDVEERPERPIPSGAISRRAALGLGVSLLLAGPLFAWLLAGRWAGIAAVGVALAVTAYDGGLKHTALGAPTMGLARGANVLLGVAAVTSPTAVGWRVLVVPAITVGYIAGVTQMADRETEVGASTAVLVAGVATAVAGVGGIAAAAGLLTAAPTVPAAGLSLLLLVGFLTWVGTALRRAYADPRPATVGPAVGTCVLGLVVFDAAVAATAGVVWGLVGVAFLVPAVGLARVFDVS
jgi:4-hydroxybenzoate polyprenyltransferase